MSDYTAFRTALDTLKATPSKNRKRLVIPYTPNGYALSQQLLFDFSNLTIEINADIKLTSTTRQNLFLFASDANQAPASVLENISVIGNNVILDGNGSNMVFTYAHGDGSDNHCAIRFNRVKNLYVTGITATNGAIDSFSLRACQNYLIEKCIFTNSREDNGFSATTHFATYVRGDLSTYSYGTIKDCVAYDNTDLGMTVYNCAGVTFENCISYSNMGGYSCEKFTNDTTVYYAIRFKNCKAYKNYGNGWYLNCLNDITLDDDCESYGNDGYIGDNTNGLNNNGVVIANCNDIYVGGKHRGNGQTGITIVNGTDMEMNITLRGKYTDNKAQGVRARGISRLIVEQGTIIKNNGNVLVNGAYNSGMDVDNNGTGYNQGLGFLIMNGVIVEQNGYHGISVNQVKWISWRDCMCIDNSKSQINEIGFRASNANRVYAINCLSLSSDLRQQFGFYIDSSVVNAFMYGNYGDANTTVILNNSANKRGLSDDTKITLGTYTTTTALSDTASASVSNINNVLATLIKQMQAAGELKQ